MKRKLFKTTVAFSTILAPATVVVSCGDVSSSSTRNAGGQGHKGGTDKGTGGNNKGTGGGIDKGTGGNNKGTGGGIDKGTGGNNKGTGGGTDKGTGGNNKGTGGGTIDAGGRTIAKPKIVTIPKADERILDKIDAKLPDTIFKKTQIARKKQVSKTPVLGREAAVATKVPTLDIGGKRQTLTEYIDQASINAPFFDMGFAWYQFFVNQNHQKGDSFDFGKVMLDKLKSQGTHEVRLGFITNAALDAVNKAGDSFYKVDWGDGDGPIHENPLKKQTVDLTKANNNKLIPTIGGTLPLWTIGATDKWGSITSDNPRDIYAKHTQAAEDNAPGGNQTYYFLDDVRKHNMDYAVSIGGYNNNSLAVRAIQLGLNASQLAESYEKIINLYDLKHIDFDIEGTDDGRAIEYLGVTLKPFQNPDGTKNLAKIKASRKLRNDALAIIKEKHKGLRITYTIPTFKNRVEDFNEEMIKDGVTRGIVDEVNLMTMDYGEESITSTTTAGTRPGEMAMYAISAANNLKNILMSTGAFSTEEQAYHHIGVTPMNGVNDVHNEVFYLTDAAILTNWAITKNIKFLSEWSALRDMKHFIETQRNDLRIGEHVSGMTAWRPDEIHNSSTTRLQDAYSTGINTDTLAYAGLMSVFESGQLVTKDFGDISRFDFITNELNFKSFEDIYNWNGVLEEKTSGELKLGSFGGENVSTLDYRKIYEDETRRTNLGYL